ncbi:hypothetical protein, partial [Nocardioides sp. NPDC000441]|uniref:hypothetical protein n=1 Tax=Nocardioides sp. NPDC000441 TaxID=3154256 RepID=UPI00332AD420
GHVQGLLTRGQRIVRWAVVVIGGTLTAGLVLTRLRFLLTAAEDGAPEAETLREPVQVAGD